jgi:DNA-binding NarL/FixJ family response regulator
MTEIAQRLVISKETVMTHRRNLMRKLGLRNKAELIRYAIKHNIGVPE